MKGVFGAYVDVLLELFVIAVFPVWMVGVAGEVCMWAEVQGFALFVARLAGLPL